MERHSRRHAADSRRILSESTVPHPNETGVATGGHVGLCRTEYVPHASEGVLKLNGRIPVQRPAVGSIVPVVLKNLVGALELRLGVVPGWMSPLPGVGVFGGRSVITGRAQ